MKRNRRTSVLATVYGFIIFFFTILLTSTSSIFVFYMISAATDNVFLIALAVIGVIIVCTLFCSASDMIRRKFMVEKPVNKILYATERIAMGDFSVKLELEHDYNKYDEYDLIFDNINTMTAELSRNEILKNDFISNVSHEIKTPLAVMQNYAKTLQLENIDESKRKECLNGLILQSNKISNLISNILKLNKLDNQEIVPEIIEFDLGELVRTCTLSFEQLIENKNLELVCDIDDVTIVSSQTLLELVINNLISNAIKFTDNGEINVSLKSNDDYVVLKVQDTGCGISKEVGEHIFDKFYQGDTSRASEGNGLGLSLVKRVIDLIGGEIAVESSINVGSTFIIKLKRS